MVPITWDLICLLGNVILTQIDIRYRGEGENSEVKKSFFCPPKKSDVNRTYFNISNEQKFELSVIQSIVWKYRNKMNSYMQ